MSLFAVGARRMHGRRGRVQLLSVPLSRRLAAPPPMVTPSRRGILLAALVQCVASLLFLPQAALLASAIAMIADGRPAGPVWLVAGGVTGLGALRAALDALAQRMAFRCARRVVSALRIRAVTALAARSPLDAGRPASGLAASVIAEQAEAVMPYLTRLRPARLRCLVMPLAILCAVLPLSWVAALALFVTLPPIPVFMALVGWRAQAASAAQTAELGGMNGFLLDRLRGLASIRALGAVDHVAKRLRANAERVRASSLAVLRIAFLSSATLELFAALGVAMVAVYVGFHLLGQLPFGAWGQRLGLGRGLFILLLAPAFYEPLRDLAAAWHDRAAGEAAMAALEALGLAPALLPGASIAPNLGIRGKAGAPAVLAEWIEFRYGAGDRPVLAGFDLRLAPGEHVALLGPSGSGKSTLLALLAGLAALDAGRITIGGLALTDRTAAALRNRIAWIGQTPHLFAGTPRANVGMGRAGIDGAAVERAMRCAAFDAVAAERPGATIGEGGAGLSGGEALRLAIARAAANASADLVLADEPTAHLDAATAAELIERLLHLSAGRTLIIATHDPVLAARMDRVVRMEAQS